METLRFNSSLENYRQLEEKKTEEIQLELHPVSIVTQQTKPKVTSKQIKKLLGMAIQREFMH
jgi:hypothetical protein